MAPLPPVGLISLLSHRAGLADRHGARRLLIAGSALASCGFALLGFDKGGYATASCRGRCSGSPDTGRQCWPQAVLKPGAAAPLLSR